VDALSNAINQILQFDDVTRQLRLQGMEALGGSPEEFASRIKSDTAQWDAVLQAAELGR
jgi:tripartite-type tricarboxylate transporter receptor subunit TctC